MFSADIPLAALGESERRLALLADPAFTSFGDYRSGIAARFGPTPHVDPLDGGTAARVLVLLETPGPRGATPRFVSRDNTTGTARNLRRFLAEAGLERRDTILWNTVPWVVHDEGARNRALRREEIAAGLSLLSGFVALLPRLRIVVLAGRVAAWAVPILPGTRPDLTLLVMPHPSPTFFNTQPEVAAEIASVLAAAAVRLDPGTAGPQAARG